MAFFAKVKADSISPDGCRLSTIEATYPRLVHSEVMTHRMWSRNSASTRAIPIAVQLKNVLFNPFIPEKFGINKSGMQADEFLSGTKHLKAVEIWLRGRDRALTTTLELILGDEIMGDLFGYVPGKEFVSGERLAEKFKELTKLLPKSGDLIDLRQTSMLNAHKQLAGRGLEAYMWHTIVLTGTEFDNFLALRDHADAQGEIATIARHIRTALKKSTPKFVDYGQWHTPYVDEDEFPGDIELSIKASAARAGSASYGRQDVKRSPEDEVIRYQDYRDKFHMSPLEHQATPISKEEREIRNSAIRDIQSRGLSSGVSPLAISQLVDSLEFSGNFRGWRQHRKDIPNEDNFGKLEAA